MRAEVAANNLQFERGEAGVWGVVLFLTSAVRTVLRDIVDGLPVCAKVLETELLASEAGRIGSAI